MSVYSDPHIEPHFQTSALITIDLQRDFLSESPYGIPGTTEVLPAVYRVITAFRAAGRPIVHVVRLYERGGGNAEPVRKQLLSSGVDIVAPGSVGSQLAQGLAPDGAADLDHELLLSGRPQQLGPDEYVVFKPRWGAFYRTAMEELLHGLGVDTVVFVGCNLPNCPRSSIVEASERDFRVVLVPDAVSKVTELGLNEIAGLGVHLLRVDELTAQLDPAHAVG